MTALLHKTLAGQDHASPQPGLRSFVRGVGPANSSIPLQGTPISTLFLPRPSSIPRSANVLFVLLFVCGPVDPQFPANHKCTPNTHQHATLRDMRPYPVVLKAALRAVRTLQRRTSFRSIQGVARSCFLLRRSQALNRRMLKSQRNGAMVAVEWSPHSACTEFSRALPR